MHNMNLLFKLFYLFSWYFFSSSIIFDKFLKWMSIIIDTEDYTREKFDRSGVFHPIFLFTREKGYQCVGLFWENGQKKIITGFFKRSSYSPNNCLGLSHLLLLCIPKSRWLKPINNTYKWNDLLNAVKEFSLWTYCNNMYILKVRKTNLFLFCWP